MGRENAEAKARRYLGEARLTVTHVGGGEVNAKCRGGGRFYEVGFGRGRGWYCDCPAYTPHCAHILALKLVTVAGEAS